VIGFRSSCWWMSDRYADVGIDALPPQPAPRVPETAQPAGIHAGPHHLRATRPRLGPRPARPGHAASQTKFPVAAAHLGDAIEDILALTADRESAQGVMGKNNISGTRLTIEAISA
jgi:hypothetical protein